MNNERARSAASNHMRLTAVAGVVAAAVGLVPAMAWSNGGGSRPNVMTQPQQPPAAHGPKHVSQAPFEDPRLMRQTRLTDAADRILSLTNDRAFGGLGGTMIDHDAGTVVVFWNGSVPNEMARLVQNIRGQGTRVEMREAPHSYTELDAEARRIAGLDASDTGVHVTGAGILQDYSGIEVSVAPEDLDAAPAAIDSPFKLEFKAMPEVQTVGRWDDVSPFWGGAAIDHNTGLLSYAYCTTAFATKRSTGVEAMITARHCGTDWDWFTPNNDQFVGHTANGSASLDATVLTGANYGPQIYAGGVDNSVGRWIVGANNPADESYVFASGSWSGAHTLRVKDVGAYANVDGTVVGPGFWTKDEELDGSVGQGDSGGPTAGASSGSYTDVIGRGMIDAIDPNTQKPCLGVQSSGRQCAYRAFHVNIQAILNGLNLTIQKKP